jgi:hypothetical protein
MKKYTIIEYSCRYELFLGKRKQHPDVPGSFEPLSIAGPAGTKPSPISKSGLADRSP